MPKTEEASKKAVTVTIDSRPARCSPLRRSGALGASRSTDTGQSQALLLRFATVLF